MGTEFKTVACSVTETFLSVYIQIGKEGIKNRSYHMELGEKPSCTNRTTKTTKVLGQSDVKGSTKDFFVFISWFSSNSSAKYVMDAGKYIIGMVKTNTKLFYKNTTKNMTNYWIKSSYLEIAAPLKFSKAANGFKTKNMADFQNLNIYKSKTLQPSVLLISRDSM